MTDANHGQDAREDSPDDIDVYLEPVLRYTKPIRFVRGTEELATVVKPETTEGIAAHDFYQRVLSLAPSDSRINEDSKGAISWEEAKDFTAIGSSQSVGDDGNGNRMRYCHECQQSIAAGLFSAHLTSITHQISRKNVAESPDVYGLDESNVGYRLLKNEGWTTERGLGAQRQGRKLPIPTKLKNDKLGIGTKSANKRQITHSQEDAKVATASAKIHKRKISNRKERDREAESDRVCRQEMLKYMNRHS
jgi:hypothetical protein